MKGHTAAAVLLIHLAGGIEADAYTFDSEADQEEFERRHRTTDIPVLIRRYLPDGALDDHETDAWIEVELLAAGAVEYVEGSRPTHVTFRDGVEYLDGEPVEHQLARYWVTLADGSELEFAAEDPAHAIEQARDAEPVATVTGTRLAACLEGAPR